LVIFLKLSGRFIGLDNCTVKLTNNQS